jgi:hypothetical protein
MKAFLLAELTPEQQEKYRQSQFFKERVLQSYQYSGLSIDYYQEYFGSEYQNHSIIVVNDKGDALLVAYAYSKNQTLTHFEAPVTIIETNWDAQSEKQLAYRTFNLKLNEHLVKHAFNRILFYDNPFLTAAYYSKIEKTQTEFASYIDLSLSEAELKSNIRKSYKSLVNWGEKNLRIELIDQDNADYEKFILFRDFHIRTAGRKTRSERSWDLQFESIKNQEAYLVLAFFEEKLVSGTLVLYGKQKAYYGVGVYDRELMAQNVAVAHYNMMYSIFHAKKIGLRQFDLGHHNEGAGNEKEVNIFHFKSGFTNQIASHNKLTALLNTTVL